MLLIAALLLAGCGGRGDSTPTSTPTTEAAPMQEVETPTSEPEVEITSPATPEEPTDEATATAEPTAEAAPTEVTTTEDPEVDAIVQDVARLRGLEVKAPIELRYKTKEQLRKELLEYVNEEYPRSEARADERVFTAFGLIDEDTDLRKLFVDLYTEQIAGSYDPETDELYVIKSGGELTAVEELTYAHEIVHALQDQHFDLEALSEPYEDKNDDASVAISSLVEGDAVLFQFRDYAREKPELLAGYLEAVGQKDFPVLQGAPPIIASTLLFPYEAGANFVMALQNQGGWEAVDAAYEDPPTSTEQILHPDRYLDRDEPTDLKLPDISSALGPGWKKLEQNLFGEFQTRILLEGEGRVEQARAAAEGWDADWFALWANGDQEVVVWQSAWDSEEDAQEFARALRAYDEARFEAPYAEQGDALLLSGAAERAAMIQADGTRVSYVLAPTPELAKKVMETLAP